MDLHCWLHSQENKREERKRLADDEAMRKIRMLEETVHQLQKQVAAQKQVDISTINLFNAIPFIIRF